MFGPKPQNKPLYNPHSKVQNGLQPNVGPFYVINETPLPKRALCRLGP